MGQEQHTSIREREVGIDNLYLTIVFLNWLTKFAVVFINEVLLYGFRNHVRLFILDDLMQVWSNTRGNSTHFPYVCVFSDHLRYVVLGKSPYFCISRLRCDASAQFGLVF